MSAGSYPNENELRQITQEKIGRWQELAQISRQYRQATWRQQLGQQLIRLGQRLSMETAIPEPRPVNS